MDMRKIGLFLSELRKENNLTQEKLGEKIGVTNKTVSRWENGNYLPPVEVLQILSKLYGVSINEILSGERLDDGQYRESAEENIVENLLKSRAEAKKRLALSLAVALIAVVSGTAIVLLTALLDAPLWVRICGVVLAFITVACGVGVCCVLTLDAGVYECPHCGAKFVPSIKAFVFGAHTFTKRRLKCPNCGKKSFCKKRLG